MEKIRFPAAVLLTMLVSGCSYDSSSETPATPVKPPPVYVVLFIHIEDNTPAGTLGLPTCRTNYLNLRARLIEMGALARSRDVRWSLEPERI